MVITEITKPGYALVTFAVDTDSHSELAELRELEDMSRNKEYVRITVHKSQHELDLSPPFPDKNIWQEMHDSELPYTKIHSEKHDHIDLYCFSVAGIDQYFFFLTADTSPFYDSREANLIFDDTKTCIAHGHAFVLEVTMKDDPFSVRNISAPDTTHRPKAQEVTESLGITAETLDDEIQSLEEDADAE